MKTLIFVAAVLFSTFLFAVDKKIIGNGNIVNIEKKLDYFNKVSLSGTYKVFIIQSDSFSIKIETDENIASLYEPTVVNNTLSINLKSGYSIQQTSKFNIYIKTKEVNQVNSIGTGNIEIGAFNNIVEFELNNNSTGNIDLQFNCNKLILNNSGTGILKFNANANEIIMKNSATGNLNFPKLNSKIISIYYSGTGNISLVGTCTKLDIKHTGTGDINAFDLITEESQIIHNGIGGIDLNVTKELNVLENKSGSIRFMGSAILKKVNSNGTLKKMD